MDEAGNDDIGRGKDGRKPFIKQAGDDATDIQLGIQSRGCGFDGNEDVHERYGHGCRQMR